MSSTAQRCHPSQCDLARDIDAVIDQTAIAGSRRIHWAMPVIDRFGVRNSLSRFLALSACERVNALQVGEIAMMTTDLVFVGRVGAEAVAAAALASRIYLVSFTLGAGLLAPIAPLAAQAFGADNLAVVRRSLRMGLWAALLLSFPIVTFALHEEQILLAFGQAPDAARRAQQYLFGLASGVAPALGFFAVRNFMSAVNPPRPILWITLAAAPVNGLLVYLLISGRLGLPRLELFGWVLRPAW